MFRQFAEAEFRGASPLYEQLALLVADRPSLAAPLDAAPPGRRRPTLFFAAIQYLLRRSAHHPLARYYPSLGGTVPSNAKLASTFTDFLSGRWDEIAELCATRTVQTNEPRRAALLWPAFGRASRLLGGAPLALVELGTRAGLRLLGDHYPYSFGIDEPQPAVDDRVGIDPHPIGPDDTDGQDWLRACVWPEHLTRLARLDEALAIAAKVRPRMVAGELLEALPSVLAGVDGVPCVFASNALSRLDSPGRVPALLAGLGRDAALVLNEGPDAGVHLIDPSFPAPAPGRCVLTLVVYRDGVPHAEALGETGPYGAWLSWSPRPLQYGGGHAA